MNVQWPIQLKACDLPFFLFASMVGDNQSWYFFPTVLDMVLPTLSMQYSTQPLIVHQS